MLRKYNLIEKMSKTKMVGDVSMNKESKNAKHNQLSKVLVTNNCEEN